MTAVPLAKTTKPGKQALFKLEDETKWYCARMDGLYDVEVLPEASHARMLARLEVLNGRFFKSGGEWEPVGVSAEEFGRR